MSVSRKHFQYMATEFGNIFKDIDDRFTHASEIHEAACDYVREAVFAAKRMFKGDNGTSTPTSSTTGSLTFATDAATGQARRWRHEPSSCPRPRRAFYGSEGPLTRFPVVPSRHFDPHHR